MLAHQEASSPSVQRDAVYALWDTSSRPQGCEPRRCSTEQCPLFRNIGIVRNFEAGDVIFWDDDPNDYLYLVLSGIVRGSKVLSDGRRQIARFAFRGEMLEYARQSQCPFTAEAITPVCALAIPRRQFDRVMNETPCLQGLLMRALLSELQETQSQVLTLGRFSAIERVAQFLHILTQSLEPDSDGAFEFPMNRRDMADYLGLTIETVSRIINRPKRAGKIRLLGSNRFVIPDEDEFVDELLATAS